MHPKIKERLKNSWAEVFYHEVFRKIDESAFRVLYCKDNGRPNSREHFIFLIKHLFNYTDEVLIDLEEAALKRQPHYSETFSRCF